MANAPSTSPNSVTVTVVTGDVKYVDNDDTVMINFVDINGKSTEETEVVIPSRKRKGQDKTIIIPNLSKGVKQGFGPIQYIEIWRKSEITIDRVFVYHLDIQFGTGQTSLIFPIHRWIPHGKKLCIRPNDSYLPQDEQFVTQRKEELAAKRELYKLVEKQPGLPPECENMPEDESFSTDYQWDFTKRAIELKVESKLTEFAAHTPESIKDFKELYYFKNFPLPECAKNEWYKKDDYFGEQRLSGCNPTQITLCTSIPENFAVTEEMVKDFIEGKSLESVMEEKRLFIIDYTMLANLDTTHKKWKVPAPFALLYKNSDNQLMPIAIQLQQKPSYENPVFLPSDPPNTWLLAKMWCNLADCTMHQAKVHLGFTHLLAEAICVTTHRQLSPSHPIFRLLAPHFLYLIAINHLAMTTLIEPQGVLDQTMAMGRIGTFDVVRRSRVDWKFNEDGNPKTEAEKRGVGKDVLPHYPYRDDAILVYEAIHEYVTDVVKGVYTEEERLNEDYEIQNWYKMLSTPAAQGGAGFQGISGNGEIATVDNIIDILATIIFISSVQHAAVNFNQYDQYGFPAVYPAHLNGSPPTSKKALDEKDILATLPTTDETVEIMVLTQLLSMRATKSLGDFEVQYAFDEISKEALNKFRLKLESLSLEILTRHPNRGYPYKILDPKKIPNAISI